MTRTPPHFKWLLNERAMLAGEAQRINRQIQALQGLLPPLTEKLLALDSAMALFDARVRPDAAGVVLAHDKYGERGALIKRVEFEIRAAGASGVDTLTLANRIAVYFGFAFETKKEFTKFCQDTVGSTVRDLKNKGSIEALFASRGGHVPSVWRAKKALSVLDLRGAVELRSGP
ncbi:MAG: hypothetical protein ACREBY_11270 [Polaromonas sp.]